MQVIYNLLSAIIIVISVTGLITYNLKGYHYIILIVYVMLMAELGSITNLGQVTGVVMAPILFLILALFIKENRIWNLCVGCIGYLVNITFNNIMLYFVAKTWKISVYEISVTYWLPFCIGYIISFSGLLYLIRKIIGICNWTEMKGKKSSKTMLIGLFVNLMFFLIIFVINISMGERIGYSIKGIKFNIILFAICMMTSSVLIIICIKTVKRDEEQKAEEKKLEILETYIKNLEIINDKTSAFRHDYKNMLLGLSGFLKEGRVEEMKTYLSNIIQMNELDIQENTWKELKNVDALELKGFLYEKILYAQTKNIKIKVQIDEKFQCECSYMKDIIRILGVFLDNSIEETQNMENGYIVIVAMNTTYGVLFSVINNYKKKPDLAVMRDKGYTTKGENRGMGLYWAEKLIKKYGIIHNVDISEGEITQKIEIVN